MDESISLDIKKEYVKRQPVFSKLTAEEVETLASLLTEKHFAPGDTIVTEGDPVDSVFLIVSGTADVRHISIKDHLPEIKSLATLGAGDAIGLNETGFYSLSGIRTATVVAQSPMVSLYLSLAQFHGFALAYPHVNEIMRKNKQDALGTE